MSDGDVVVRASKSPLELLQLFLSSSVGAKIIMALTGLVMWGFVLGHMIGNLQIFQSDAPDALAAYGHMLHTLGHGVALWVVRGALLLTIVAHVFFGLRLARLNTLARGTEYKHRKNRRTNFASTTMAISGIIILVFIVVHLLHFTGHVLPGVYKLDAEGRFDVYSMMYDAFKNPAFVALYVVGQLLLLSHLIHGTVSVWQSLGLHHLVWSKALAIVGRALAIFIVAGNIAMPLAVFFFFQR